MNAPKTMNLLAGLRVATTASGRGSQSSVQITADTMDVVVDNDTVAAAGCKAIADTIKRQMRAGYNPFTNTPLPPLDPDTAKRRDYRIAQADRGGAASDHYKDKAKRRTVRRNWRRRFKATKAGMFTPSFDNKGLFGSDSGMLVETLVAVQEKNGQWGIFAANKRSINDAKGGSAVQRVFGRLLSGGAGQLFVTPGLRKRLEQMATAMVIVNLARGLGGLFKALAKQLPELVEQARETYDIGQDIVEE